MDYTNAFAQAKLNERVFIEPPQEFRNPDGCNKVLRLIKSLYGLRQAQKTFFEKLKAGLLERDFTQSDHDPCLFMKRNMIVVVYVDDTIIAGPNMEDIDDFVTSLGIQKLDQLHQFAVKDEGEVGERGLMHN